MKYIHGENIEIFQDLAITIGKFDGLHKGHMALIDKLKKVANNHDLATAVLSFSPHPAAVLSGKNIPLILSQYEKISLLEQEGIDYYIEFPFTHQFAQVLPENFIEDIIFKQLQTRALVVGENFRFGESGRGDVALAQEIGAKLGLHVHTLPLVADKNAQISSETIRKMINTKDFCGAKQACGRDFFLMGDAVQSKKKGQQMGFPAANIITPKNKLLPPAGVYHTRTFVDDISYESISNVNANNVETRLQGYTGDLYGRYIRIDFLQSLDEK